MIKYKQKKFRGLIYNKYFITKKTCKMNSNNSLSNSAATGTVWTITQSILNKFATLASLYIISLKLTPDQFGVAALVIAIGKFAVFLPPLTMGDVIISKSHDLCQNYTRINIFIIKVGFFIALTIAASAPLIALFYNQYQYGMLVGFIMLMSLRPLGDALAVSSLSQLRIGLKYRIIALIDGWVQFSATIFTVVMVVYEYGAISILLPQIISVFIKSICYKYSVRNKINIPTIDSEANKCLDVPVSNFLTAGSAQYIHSILDTFPILMMGRFATESQVGIYGFAVGLAGQANAIISFQLGSVLQPIFGKLKHDIVRQKLAYLRAINAISAVIVPIALIQAVLAEPFFLLFLNPNWQPCIKVFSILSIVEAFYFATSPTIALFKSQSRFRTYFTWQIIQLLVTISVYPFAIIFGGAVGAAIAGVVLWGISLPIAVWLAIRFSGGTFYTAIWVLVAPWINSLPVAVALFFIWEVLCSLGQLGQILSLFVVGPLALIFSLWSTQFIQPATYFEIRNLFKNIINNINRFVKLFFLPRKLHGTSKNDHFL